MLVLNIAAVAASIVAGAADAEGELRATTSPVSPPRYLVLGTWYGKATPAFVDAGKAAGFNAVRVTANWGNMETTPGVIDWSVLDNQTAYVHDVAKLPLIFNIWCQRFRPDTVVPREGLALDQHGNGAVNNVTWSISFANKAAVGAAAGFVKQVVQRYGARYPNTTLLWYACFDGYSETEFFPSDAMLGPGQFDYSANAQTAFKEFLAKKYRTIGALSTAWAVSPPLQNFSAALPPHNSTGSSQREVDWYLLRELILGTAIRAIRDAIHGVKLPTNTGTQAPPRAAVQWGSVFDGAVRNRGLIDFPDLAAGIECVWVDDTATYPSSFAMDYLRSNLQPGTWLANEIDGPSRGTDAQYYEEARSSYSHGCAVLSVANWDLATLKNRSVSLFQRIAADFLGRDSSLPPFNGAMNISARAVFEAGSAMNAVPEYMSLSNNATSSVQVKLVRDLDQLDWQASKMPRRNAYS